MALNDRNRKRFEFGQRGAAGRFRDELPEEAILEADDGREKTLKVDKSALSREQVQRIEGEAAISRDDARGDMHGQESLTDAEKKRLDFTETTVPEARTAKASLLGEGVSDWTAYFDPSLTTSEMADLARSTQASGGERLDSADTQRARDRQGAQMQREVKGKQAKRAREGCKDGFEEACDQLVEKHNVSRAEAERLLGGAPMQGGAVAADGGLVDTTVLRASAPGTFMREPPEPSPDAPGYRNGSTGRFVGYEIDEYDNAKRSPENGRIKTLGEADPVPRGEAISRWGRPDGIDGDPTDVDRDQAMRDALFENPRMTPEEEVTAKARAADVSLEPGEALDGEFTDGMMAQNPGSVTTDEGDSLIAQDLSRTKREDAAESAGVFGDGMSTAPENDPFDITSGGVGDDLLGGGGGGGGGGMFADDRDQQGTLEVGMGAGVTEDRSGQVAGSANFADERDELMPDQEVGEQAGLVEQDTNVGGDGQADLFGGNASETSGAEYRS